MKETWNMGITYSGKMYPCLEIFLLCNSVSFSKARRNRVSFFYLRKMKTSPGQAFISDSFRLLYKSSFFPISRIDHFPSGLLLPYILQRYIKCDLNDHGFRHSQVFLSIKYVIQEVLQLDLIILNKWNIPSWVKKNHWQNLINWYERLTCRHGKKCWQKGKAPMSSIFCRKFPIQYCKTRGGGGQYLYF